jgi:hypothetical protein
VETKTLGGSQTLQTSRLSGNKDAWRVADPPNLLPKR